MACFHPVRAYRIASGGVTFHESARNDNLGPVDLPCGRCIGCRARQARDWQTRLQHTAQFWGSRGLPSCMVTLTYDEAHLPPRGALQYRDVQLFLKRLRKWLYSRRAAGDVMVSKDGPVCSFFCAGEYGSQLSRPHYHLILFGVDFRHDQKLLKVSRQGFNLWKSATLAKLWPFGHASFNAVSPQSIGYVAQYCTKKVTGVMADSHYARVDAETGECYQLPPEFARMSLRPAIGREFFALHGPGALTETDYVVVDGKKRGLPKYYDKLLRKADPLTLESKTYERMKEARKRLADSTPERLAAREACALAKQRFYKRDST